MSLSLTPNNDGTWIASCGDEEVVLYPDGTIKPRRKQKSILEVIGGGTGHQALVVRVGMRQESPWPGVATSPGTVLWNNSDDFPRAFQREVAVRSENSVDAISVD